MRAGATGAALGLALAVMACASAGIGRDVYQGAEAREALVAREMLLSGDWTLPRWNGAVIPSKPPLFHWMAAGIAAWNGGRLTETAVRAPSVLLAGATVAMCTVVGAAWGGPTTGALAGLVLATTPQFLGEARHGRVDMTLCATVTAALLLGLGLLRTPGGTARLAAFGVALGLAMLAKGPVGPGLVGVGVLAAACVERRPGLLRSLAHPLPLVLALAVGGGWYLAAWLDEGHDFVAKQILSENGEALLGGSRIPFRSPFFYVPRLVGGGLPWVVLLPWAALAAWRAGGVRRWLLVAALADVAFLSLVPLKRGAYLLPVRPMLALVVGWWLADVVREARAAGRLVPIATATTAVIAVLALGTGVVVELVARGIVPVDLLARRGMLDVAHSVEVVRAWRPVLLGAAGAMAASSLAVAVALRRDRWLQATLGAAASVGILAATLGAVVDPARATQKSVRGFAETIRAHVPPERPLVFLTGETGAEAGLPLVFYLGRRVVLRPAPAKRRRQLPPGFYVLDQERWARWEAPPGWRELARSPHLFSTHRRDLVLVEYDVPAAVSPPAGS